MKWAPALILSLLEHKTALASNVDARPLSGSCLAMADLAPTPDVRCLKPEVRRQVREPALSTQLYPDTVPIDDPTPHRFAG